MIQEMKTMDGNQAAAHVAYAYSEVAAIYPITPSSTMAEYTDEWAAEGRQNIFGHPVEVSEMQSEAGAAGAVHGALAAGALTSTFTSSQGLLLMLPNIYRIAGELLPGVFHVAARTIATHALSIFGDHSDIYACRQTGAAIWSCASVQEVMDLSPVSHLAAIQGRIPFLNFFDGFRTSHEMQKIRVWNYDDLKELADMDAIERFRSHALNPEHGKMTGSAQNPDIFFQAREACNLYYDTLPGIVDNILSSINQKLGTSYGLFDYYGDFQAEHVIIAMGSVCETIEETIDYMNERGYHTGLVKVHLYRPFSAQHLLSALPSSVRQITVLNRTKEPGAVGEPLYLDVVAALKDTPFAQVPVYSGRYGLSSKNTTPEQIWAVFCNQQKNKFTVGIHDDVTHLSLELPPSLDIGHENTICCKFWGLGGDGTVSANKSSVKIIGNHTKLYAQAYFDYDSKKSRGLTISHLRFGTAPIRSAYLIDRADFVACHNPVYLHKFDCVQELRDGGIFLLNCYWKEKDLEEYLPGSVKRYLAEHHIRFYIIDAIRIGKEIGLNNKISTILQAAFFRLLCHDSETAAESDAASSDSCATASGSDSFSAGSGFDSFSAASGSDGSDAASGSDGSSAGSGTAASVTGSDSSDSRPLPGSSPARKSLMSAAEALSLMKKAAEISYRKKGDRIVRMNWEAIERGFRDVVEVTVPPHWKDAVEEPFDTKLLPDRPEVLAYVENLQKPISAQKGNQLPVSAFLPYVDGSFPSGSSAHERRNVATEVPVWKPENCIQCNRCSYVCPHAVIRPAALTEREKEAAPENMELLPMTGMPEYSFAITISQTDCTGCGSCVGVCPGRQGKKALEMYPINEHTEKQQYFDYCKSLPPKPEVLAKFKGNTVKGSQFKQPLLEFHGACAGCGETTYPRLITQLFGERMYIANATGCSSIWANSSPSTTYACNPCGQGPAWGNSLFEDAAEFGYGFLLARRALKDTGKSFWIFGGDGWAYDIGFSGLDHILASGENINILVMDTEVYSNTGGQASKATPVGSTAKFASGGKRTRKKDLASMAMSYGHVYVAQIAMGADYNQTIKAITEAEAYDGPSLIIAYAPCISHGIQAGMGSSQHEEAKAVEAGYWHLFRFHPDLKAQGKNPFQLDSKEPSLSYQEFLKGENRYSVLSRMHPEKAEALFAQAEEDSKERYRYLKKLVTLYEPEDKNTEGS